MLESKHPKFPKDAIVCGLFGWRTHSIFNPDTEVANIPSYVLPEFDGLPLSLGLGLLGMPGITAYFGFLENCQPKPNEVVVVTGAAGAVGSIVGQIAKVKGCKVIGVAGSDDKCKWLTEELGFDHAINYKTADIDVKLEKFAPDGVDCYYDNVGGSISSTIINHHMRDYGRITVCGSISAYNTPADELPKVPALQQAFLGKQLTMKGFHVFAYLDRWFEGIAALKQWTAEGKIKYRETITDGFENMPQAFIDMLNGKNIGKAIVRVGNGLRIDCVRDSGKTSI